MALELVNPDPRYGQVHLIEPAPLGYLHLAADAQAPRRPGPVLRRSRGLDIAAACGQLRVELGPRRKVGAQEHAGVE